MFDSKKSLNLLKLISIAFLIVLSINLCAEKLYLSINYLGLGVVDVEMEDIRQSVKVTAKATPLASLAAGMDNTYYSEYINNFLPKIRQKKIIQKDYYEDRVIDYDHQNEIATRISNIDEQKNKTYPIHSETRDFFTALYFIRNHLDNPQELFLDANCLIWSCNYEVVEKETISSCLGDIPSLKVKIIFKKMSDEKKERSDMLTNNLVNENKPLYIWFSDDENHLPLKTRYSRKPFPVYWVLESYEL